MIKRPLVMPLLLVLSLQAMPLAAQSAPAETPQTVQESANTDGDKSDTALDATAPNRSTQKKTPPATGNTASPSQAPQKPPVSEDNSTDFPVNI